MTPRKPSRTDAGIEEVREYVRSKVSAELRARSLTQKDLSDSLGISQTSVMRFLNGFQWFSFENFVGTAKFFGIPLSELFPSHVKANKVLQGYELSPDKLYKESDEMLKTFAKARNLSVSKLRKRLNQLPPIESLIIRLRHLIFPSPSLQTLSEILNLSRQRIFQIEQDAFLILETKSAVQIEKDTSSRYNI